MCVVTWRHSRGRQCRLEQQVAQVCIVAADHDAVGVGPVLTLTHCIPGSCAPENNGNLLQFFWVFFLCFCLFFFFGTGSWEMQPAVRVLSKSQGCVSNARC